MYKLAPSILAADISRLGEEVKAIEKAGAEYVHIDIMDGAFVPNLTFGMPIIKAIRDKTNCIFDVHLMIEEPLRYLNEIYKVGADIISVHAESTRHLQSTVARIKELGAKACVALNPATPLDVLEYVLNDLDMVLIMSVNPGFGGQKLIPSTYEKVKHLKKLIDEKNLNIDIEVDGGINIHNVTDLIEAGANVIVVGTSLFSGDILENVSAFKEAFENVSKGIDGR